MGISPCWSIQVDSEVVRPIFTRKVSAEALGLPAFVLRPAAASAKAIPLD